MPGTKELLAAGVAATVMAGGAYALTVAAAPGGTTAVTAAGASSAVAARTWKIKQVANYAKKSQYGSMLALSSHDVWAGGNTGTACCGDAIAAHWNGSKWSNVPLPSGFGKSQKGFTGQLRGLSGSASTNVWAVADSAVNGYTYTLRWNGHGWSVQHNWKYKRLDAVTVLGPKDVWATDALDETRGAWHFAGKSWKLVKAPMMFTRLSALSAKDIWAAGWVTGGNGLEQPRLGHWNGRSWTIVPTPEITSLSDRIRPQLLGISAASAHDVWAVGSTGAADGTTVPVALHWDGKTWQRFQPTGVVALRFATADGSGGVWAGEDIEQGLHTVVHFSHGKWSVAKLPGRKGAISEIADLSRVPGSTTMWGAGRLIGPWPKAGYPPQQGEVLAY